MNPTSRSRAAFKGGVRVGSDEVCLLVFIVSWPHSQILSFLKPASQSEKKKKKKEGRMGEGYNK